MLATIQTRASQVVAVVCALAACSTTASGTDAGALTQKDAALIGVDAGAESFDKYALWIDGPRLRGANIYQQDEGRDDGESKAGFGPAVLENDLVGLRQAGANLVILSVPGTYHVRSPVPWPAMQAHLRKIVDWAERADLFVVIAYRTGPGRGEGDITEDGLSDRTVYSNDVQRRAWVEMWRQTAEEYAAKRHVVGYDIQVEPHDHTPAQWSTLAQNIIDGIRELDTKTPILVSPGDWGGYDALEAFVPLADSQNRLIYSVHQYEPYEFTHQDMQLSAAAIDETLEEIYSTIGQWTNAHDTTVAITEFGYDIGRSKATSLHYLSSQLDEIESRELSHSIWLWEVAAADYHDFDIRFYPDVLQEVTARWAENADYPINPTNPQTIRSTSRTKQERK